MESSQSTSECHLLKGNAFGWSMEIPWHCERETLLLIMFPDDVVQNRQVLLDNFIVMEKLAPLGLRVWVCLLLFSFRGAQAHLSSRYSSQRPKGETSSLCPEFERPVFRRTVQKKIFVEMVARASTHHPESRLQGWVLGQNIRFLNLSFQGQNLPWCLMETTVFGTKASMSWLPIHWLPQAVCPATCITLTQGFHCRTESDTNFPQHLGSFVPDILSFLCSSTLKNTTLEIWYWLFQALR